MRAIVVQQPWAGLIATGRKTVELRSWRTNLRERIAICAGASAWSDEATASLGDGPRGVVLCTVEVVECRLATEADRAASAVGHRVKSLDGLFAWVLERPERASGARVRGMPGIFTIPAP